MLNRSGLQYLSIKYFLNFVCLPCSSIKLLYCTFKSKYLFYRAVVFYSFISITYSSMVFRGSDILVPFFVFSLSRSITFSANYDALNFLYCILPSAFNIYITLFTTFWNFSLSFIWLCYLIILLLYLNIETYPNPFIFFIDLVKADAGNLRNNPYATADTTI